jgi:DNA-binding MarR family transcriptional regulator
MRTLMDDIPADDPAFHQRPPFQLVLLGNRLNASNSRYYMTELGIGVIEGRLLGALSAERGQTASELCAKLGMDQAAASRALQILINRKLVATAAHADDARRRSLMLTDEGRDVQRKLVRHVLRRTEIALTGFTPAERMLLSEFISRLTKNADLLDRDIGIPANGQEK